MLSCHEFHGKGRARKIGPTLALFFLSLAVFGCAHTYRLVPEELPAPANHSFNKVVCPARILEVSFKPEAYAGGSDRSNQAKEVGVVFNEAGGQLDPQGSAITGVNSDGEAVIIPLDKVSLLRVHWTDAGNPFITLEKYMAARSLVDTAGIASVKRGKSYYWDVVDFDGKGGSFDSTTASIVGTSKRGNAVRIEAEDMYYAEYRIKDMLRPVRIGLTAGVLGFVAFGIATVFDF